MTARTDLAAGGRAIAPFLLGVVPFGLVAGVTAVDVGFSMAQVVGMSVVLFAGASQLVAIDLVGRDAAVAVVVLTTVVVNLRYLMYSASIAPYFRRFDAPTKWFGAYVLTDQAYAVSVTEFRETDPDERSRRWFYFGAALTLWVTWQASTLAGALAGATVPEGLSLEFAVPLTFVALLFQAVEDRPTEMAAVAAGGSSALLAALPYELGLVTAALVGIVLGVAVEVRRGAFPTTGHAPDHGSGVEGGADGGGEQS